MDAEDFNLPPGCKSSILGHPTGKNEAVEVAIFPEHRYAFFFWASWTHKNNWYNEPPALISFDWHEDLCPIDEDEQAVLQNLDLGDRRQLALCCWETLNPLNDGHIAAAVYSNVVGDVFVVRKQDGTDGATTTMSDRYGNTHSVRCFDTVQALLGCLNDERIDHAYFDVDLDYFTESPDADGGGANVILVNRDVVRAMLDPRGSMMQWLFPRLAGMTIATEPEFCGGINNSNTLMSWLGETLFEPQLLAPDSGWRHLTAQRIEDGNVSR